jgi:hypothetical protein
MMTEVAGPPALTSFIEILQHRAPRAYPLLVNSQQSGPWTRSELSSSPRIHGPKLKLTFTALMHVNTERNRQAAFVRLTASLAVGVCCCRLGSVIRFGIIL